MTVRPRIGFIGVGRMGSNMARRLKDCEFPIAGIYDLNFTLAETLAEELQALACKTLQEVTHSSDVIITVVNDDASMRDIYGRSDDHLLINARGKLFINCATVSPEVHVELTAQAEAVGAKMLETPMASSITQAREGSLYLMCAGDPAVFESAKPVLESMATSIMYTGKTGTAAQLKALVNMVMNINTAGLAEGLALADALRLDLNQVRTVFSQTGANSRVLETDGPDMQHREHEPYFSAAHAAKDSQIALTLGQRQGLLLPLAEATQHQYARMVQLGLGEIDKSGISELTFQDRRPESIKIATGAN